MEMSLFRQGCLHMLHGRYQEALTDLLVMSELHPDHPETHANLGTCYLQLNNYNRAIMHYIKALELVPGDVQLLFNLGVISVKLGQVAKAISYYNEVLKIEPGHFAAHNNLGVVYLSLQERNAALRHFQAALQADPANTAVKHTIDTLEERADVVTAPDAYVKSLFDSYADHYDEHLRQELNYKLPEAMYAMVVNNLNHVAGLSILDLGCGTGLCGELFKSLASRLTGVDLSGGMLHIAHRKNIYNDLYEIEALTYMRQSSDQYDLIVAGDVLVYVGKLDEMINAVADRLKDGGWFVFSAEISQGEEFELTSSGRFAHSSAYIEAVAAYCGLHVIAYESSNLRTQQQISVLGHLYLMQKVSTPLSCLS